MWSGKSILQARAAARLDAWLMRPDGGGFRLEQLVELAGLAVAQAAQRVLGGEATSSSAGHVWVVAGPGNNGADGLVAARHLAGAGIRVSVVQPTPPKAGGLNEALARQLAWAHVPLLDALPALPPENSSVLLVDALFGFSFDVARPLSARYAETVAAINGPWATVPMLAVDVPSGWDVDRGNVRPDLAVRMPEAWISLTAPKPCAVGYRGVHFLGGRFVPAELARSLGLDWPEYPPSCVHQIITLDHGPDSSDGCISEDQLLSNLSLLFKH